MLSKLGLHSGFCARRADGGWVRGGLQPLLTPNKRACGSRSTCAGAASLRPGVRRPPLLARKPCHLPRTYPSDLVHPSAGCGCMEDGDRLQMACSVASHSRPVERVCSMTLPEAVLARVWSDWDTVCSFRTPVSAGELDMCVSWRSGVVVGSANTRDVQTCIRCF